MKTLAYIMLCGLLVLPASNLFAQAGKFAHINSQELLAQMPESDSAQLQLENLQREYELTFEEMQVELNKKYETYLQRRETYTDLIRQTKEAEIQEMQGRIEQFNQVASQDMQQKRQELLQPIIEKANKAVREVAEENGYIYVFDVSLGNPVYFSDQSVDIMEMVKERLGL